MENLVHNLAQKKCVFMRFYHIYSKFSSKINEIRYKYLWQYGLWIFQTEVTKLERFLPMNQHTQGKLLHFENWVNGEVSRIGHHFRKESDLKIDVIKKYQYRGPN